MKCPHCGSTNIKYGEIYPVDEIIVQDAECNNCGADLPLRTTVNWQVVNHESFRYLILLDAEYVKDAKIAFNNDIYDDDFNGWVDYNGHVMLGEILAPDEETALERFKAQIRTNEPTFNIADVNVNDIKICDHIHVIQIIGEEEE